MSSLTLTAVTPAIVDSDGGRPITLQGTFPTGVPLQVYLGTTGTTADPICYAGPGNGTNATSTDGVTVTCYTPLMDPTYDFFDVTVVCPSLTLSATLTSAISSRPPFLCTEVYAFRAAQNPQWAFGPRSPGEEDPAT